MHNKTPIQKVFDIVENLYSEKIIDYITKVLLTEELNDLLAYEKEQIIDAHMLGLIHPLEMDVTKQAKNYYNQKYNNNGESL